MFSINISFSKESLLKEVLQVEISCFKLSTGENSVSVLLSIFLYFPISFPICYPEKVWHIKYHIAFLPDPNDTPFCLSMLSFLVHDSMTRIPSNALKLYKNSGCDALSRASIESSYLCVENVHGEVSGGKRINVVNSMVHWYDMNWRRVIRNCFSMTPNTYTSCLSAGELHLRNLIGKIYAWFNQ